MTNTKTTKRALLSSVMALLICFTMLLGTTFAWFTDTVTSRNNVIQTGELKLGFQWAKGEEDPASENTVWNDASNGAIFDYANWEPGYSVARHLKVSNEGTLALNYQMRIVANGILSKLADVIDVYYYDEDKALVRDDLSTAIHLGTLTEVLGTEHNLSNTINGSLKVGDPDDIHTIVLKMQTSAGDEYQAMDLGCKFSIELIATQMSSESDSFNNEYDKDTNVPNPAIPAALVRAIDPNEEFSYVNEDDEEIIAIKENLLIDTTDSNMGLSLGEINLNKAFQFEPTMSLTEAKQSEYRYWHADFVVSADKNVPADSIILAGYYDAWCELNNHKWVALASDAEIPADTEIRLVQAMGGGGITVNWEELCEYGNDGVGFVCGIGALEGTAGLLAGTTVTVELRLYETTKAWDATSGTANEETGKFITVGNFTYTFPEVTNP